MSGVPVAARLARREVVRRPWRTLVVALLVLAPAILLTGIIVVARSTGLSHLERWDLTHGREDAVVDGDPLVPLPEGTRVLETVGATGRIRTVEGVRAWPFVTDRDLDDEMSEGLVRRLEGRTPTAADEALLTRRLARRLGVGVGDELHLDRPSSATFRVVGIGEWGIDLDRDALVLGAGSGDTDPVSALFGHDAERLTLLDLPDEFADDTDLLHELGLSWGSARALRADWEGSTGQAAVVWTWIGAAVAFTILGVVISAAFAVTARRQLLLIGQLMGNGASLTVLRATLFLQGTIAGFVGSVVGVLGGIGALHVFQRPIEELLDRRILTWEARPGDLVPIVVIATLASTVAALIPARTAVRTSPLQALAGRRPLGPYPRRLVTRGAAAAGVGLFLLAVATAGAAQLSDSTSGGMSLFVLTGIVGSVAVILGTCAMSPILVSALGPLATSLRGTARLAARSVARQRSRTGAVVAAIAVVAAGAVAGTSAWLTAEMRYDTQSVSIPDDLVAITYAVGADESDLVTTPPDALLDDVRKVVPDGRVLVGERAFASGEPGPYEPTSLLVVDEEVAEVLQLDDSVRESLDRGDILMRGLGSDDDLPETQPLVMVDAAGNEVLTVEARRADASEDWWASDWAPLISPATAEALGLTTVPGPVFVQAATALTADQRDRLVDLAADAYLEYLPDDTSELAYANVWIDHPSESGEPSGLTVTAVLFAVATVATLAVVGLGLALSAAETRDERDVLAAVGAPPATLWRLASLKAVALTITGILVGIPLGFVPTALVVRVGTADSWRPLSAVFPWAQVGLLILVVPVVAALVTSAASAVALRARPVTASTMSFD